MKLHVVIRAVDQASPILEWIARQYGGPMTTREFVQALCGGGGALKAGILGRVSPMTQAPRIWHGTETERVRLERVLNANCTCEPESSGAMCPAHTLLLGDQAHLDHLVFGLRLAGQMQREEFILS